jgi:protein TonB
MAFEAFLRQKKDRRRSNLWRRLTVILSLGLHGVLLVAAGIYSVWRVDEVPPPAVSVTFLASARVAAPPPAPRPPVRREPPKPKVTAEKPEQPLVPALEQPHSPTNDKPPPPSSAVRDDSAVPGRQEGAPAGLLGDMGVAAVATVAPRPRPMPAPEPRPVTLPPSIASAQRLTDINDPRFRPSLPAPLNRAGVMLWGLFRVCVGADGNVTSVAVLKTAEPQVDGDWARVIQTWQYRPYAIDGHPMPFCHTMRLEVRGTS